MAKILIADDDVVIAHLLQSAFLDAGHETWIAKDTQQAQMLALKHRPDLILLDLTMPGGTGLSALTFLRQSATKIFIVTGNHERWAEMRAKRDGADGFFTKPIDLPALMSAAADVLPAADR
jgi:twitching motility two-component system response regulator PilH